MLVVLDANIWCSAVTSPNPRSPSRQIFDAWVAGEFTVVLTGTLLTEVAEVLVGDFGQSEADVEEFLMLLMRGNAKRVMLKHQRIGAQDKGDDHVLEAALTAGAQYIVTRDRDLLDQLPVAVHRYLDARGVHIVRDHRRPGDAIDFLEILATKPALKTLRGEAVVRPFE